MSSETETETPTAEILEVGGNIAAFKAEQETQNSIALAHPRNMRAALEEALAELEIVPDYACKAFYVIPYKDRSSGELKIVNVEGPSIKAAITLARCWKNNSQGWRVKDQTTERIEVEGVYVDHQSNTRVVRTKTVSRFYIKKGGKEKVALREDALSKAIAAAGSKAVRDAILAGVPVWYSDSYYKKSRAIAAQTIGGKANTTKTPQTYPEKLAWVLAQLKKKGVTDDQFKKYIAGLEEHKTEDERIADLVGLVNAIKDGQAKVEEVFGEQPEGGKHYDNPAMSKPDESKAKEQAAAEKTAAPADKKEPEAKAAAGPLVRIERVAKVALGIQEAILITIAEAPKDFPTKLYTQSGAVEKAAREALESKKQVRITDYAKVGDKYWLEGLEAI